LQEENKSEEIFVIQEMYSAIILEDISCITTPSPLFGGGGVILSMTSDIKQGTSLKQHQNVGFQL
jgi:hypothetical protein